MDLLSNYDFTLPNELIATTPLADRTASKLLCLLNDNNGPRHSLFKDLGDYLNEGDVLVVNNTKVRKARLYAFKATGGRVEIFLVRPLLSGGWLALLNGKGPFLPGTQLSLGDQTGTHVIKIMAKSTTNASHYEVWADVDLGVYAEEYGEIPIPRYFKRPATAKDEETYQTVFAKELGAVAAPTAGLHFTNSFLQELKSRGIIVTETTLHVGPETFFPIRTDNIDDHKMHTEAFRMDEACAHTLNQAKLKKKRIVAVGTTSMRVLEQVMQSAYQQKCDQFYACSGETSIFIRPGYRFLACDAIITNFHIPRSTLLLLVSAVVGRERVLAAYDEAIKKRYRFFSYGDACFFEVRK